jgi:hypothetical protein
MVNSIKQEDGFIEHTVVQIGARGSVRVKELYYKPEGRGFETQ